MFATRSPLSRPAGPIALACFAGALLLLLLTAGNARALQWDGAVDGGVSHTCAINPVGGVNCWGAGSYGQLGNGSNVLSMTPVQVTGMETGADAVSAGGDSFDQRAFSCAVLRGAAWCWGHNDKGQLGNGTENNSYVPVPVTGLSSSVTAISAGGNHACAIVNGGVKCWGSASFGQLGNNTNNGFSTTPVDAVGIQAGATAISANYYHACAIVNGAAKCWGQYFGKTPQQITGLESGVKRISAGKDFACAVVETDDGGGTHSGAKCWGAGDNGKLGNGDTARQDDPVDVALAPGEEAIDISTGDEFACAVVETDSGGSTHTGVRCWGQGDIGKLGNGAEESSLTPVAVAGLGDDLRAIGSGPAHTCVIEGTSVKCWGWGYNGRMGFDAKNGSSLVPVPAMGLGSGPVELAAGEKHTCALAGDVVKCWGDNSEGQLGGFPVNYNKLFPVTVPGMESDMSAVSTGYRHNCAVKSGEAWCWGRNTKGQLGNGSTGAGAPGNAAVKVVDLPVDSTVRAISAGVNHTCAIVEEEESGETKSGAWCWGSNEDTKLGSVGGDTSTPRRVQELDDGVTAIATGETHTCAIVEHEEAGEMHSAMKCWGDNRSRQLGGGSYGSVSVPQQAFGLESGVIAISAGGVQSCAVVEAEEGGVTQTKGMCTSVPGVSAGEYKLVTVPGFEDGVSAVSTSGSHTCAVVSGAVTCFGSASEGQLGNGTKDPFFQSPPAAPAIGLASGVTSVTTGDWHTCALTQAGPASTMWCWGNNDEGQLGLGSGYAVSTPRAVPGFIAGAPGTDTGEDLGGGENPGGQDPGSGTGSGTGPGTGPGSGPGSGPSSSTSPVKVKLALKKSGKPKVKGKNVMFAVTASFRIPAGAATKTACSGKLTATTKPKGVKKAAKASGKLKTKGKNCTATLKFKLPKKFKGKKVKVKLTHRGNKAVKKISQNVSYKIR